MTKGEYRVGVAFNPSGKPQVDAIKRTAADLIDLIESVSLPEGPDAEYRNFRGEVARLKAHAQTLAEDAAMVAVKAATKQPWPRET